MTRLFHRSAVALFAALLISALVAPAVSLAKTPGWTMSVTPIPTTVSPGSYAAYRVTITNGGKSNIAKIYLTDSRTESPFSVTPSTGCNSSGQLNCSLGALGTGKSVTRVVVYQTPTPTTDTSFPVTFEANTSGVSFSDGGTSHGDALQKAASTAMNGAGNFAGGYVVDAGSSFTTGGGDSQQTTVNAPKTGIGVTITESATGNPCGTGHTIGQLATLNVDDGNPLPFFLTTMTIPTSTLPEELELGQVKLCHQYDGAASGTLLPRCEADAAPGTGGAACFWPKWVGPEHHDFERHGETDADDWTWLVLDMWDTHNGNARGGY